jgi:hypothetical protein
MVGVGLTQLYLLPSKLWSYSDQLNISGFQWFAGGQATCTSHCAGPGQLLALALFLFLPREASGSAISAREPS